MRTIEEIKKAIKIEYEYIKSLKKNWLSKEELEEKTKLIGFELTNDMRSQLELHEFCEMKPNKYFVYIDEEKRIATTWDGKELGKVNFGNQWRSNFGDIRINIRVSAINGLKYSGTYFKSSGDYARIKVCK